MRVPRVFMRTNVADWSLWSQDDGGSRIPSPGARCSRAGPVCPFRLGRGFVHSLGCGGCGGDLRRPKALGRGWLAGAGEPAAALSDDPRGGGAGFGALGAERRPRSRIRGGGGAHEPHLVRLFALRSRGRRCWQRGDVRSGRGGARGRCLDAPRGLRACAQERWRPCVSASGHVHAAAAGRTHPSGRCLGRARRHRPSRRGRRCGRRPTRRGRTRAVDAGSARGRRRRCGDTHQNRLGSCLGKRCLRAQRRRGALEPSGCGGGGLCRGGDCTR